MSLISRKVSVIIPTMERDADMLESAIQSVVWADDILVVDSSFSSKVREIANKWGAKYLAHEYVYSAKQKNWAIPQARNDWILLLDSDEVVTEKLKNTLQELLVSEQLDSFDGYGIARKHFFFGKFLRWGGRYPLHNIRFFKKSCRYEDRDVHAHIVLDKSRIKNIHPEDGDILHFSDRDFGQFFERFDRYSDYQANYMSKILEKGIEVNWKRFFTNFYYFKAIIKDVWFFIPFSSFLRFLWMYVFRLGFLDGKYGFMIAILYGFQDYISKSKFKAINKKESRIRVKLGDYFMKKITPAFLGESLTRNYLRNYRKCFMGTK
jgi:hypothetical protein